ncbi:glycosyltransferase family 4 protein [Geomonas sp. Red69]|uniref:Glycosyltransferase family 4 protein n=1 Tax=Geomonas diazotrophica TaxID=2843197 RepID=A0ABX8JEJ6_9BACT|nr:MULTISPECIES: glycosyltransferase family 4 protein [Geomonas]MBU5636002.1 glycosyltransferase family 4 protein [Geomonas diazotrophica]QWV96820.1 glycosyltransferase family 4 protein [Geomonas nitrogeniifigens]
MTVLEKDMIAVRLNTSPLVRSVATLGCLLGRMMPVRKGAPLFFFYPFFHVGGAEKVHAAIVRCFAGEHPWVFFTKKSANDGFLPLFGTKARLCNLWQLLKYGYPLSVGIMAGFINKHDKPIVFGCNSLFYYLLLPYLRKEARCIDLIHAFGGGSEHFSLGVAERLDARIAINERTVNDLKAQYRANGMSDSLENRIVLIENSVDVPDELSPKMRGTTLKALYVGRGSEEKRVHLVGRVASRCRQRGIPVDVVIVGDALQAVEEPDRVNCTFLGEISDQEQLQAVYRDADLLLLTSSREGFPMVIMEAMAFGVVPVSTTVGGIPSHVHSGTNGWLVPEAADEGEIVDRMCEMAAAMCEERDLLEKLSRNAYSYAKKHFSGESFCAAYRGLLLGERC